MRCNFHDIFKGAKGSNGRIVKLRSVGHCVFNKRNAISILQLNGEARDKFYLQAENDPSSPYDFAIYSYWRKKPHRREAVGVGYLLTGVNAGLIQLEFDIYGNNELYLKLGCVEACKLAA